MAGIERNLFAEGDEGDAGMPHANTVRAIGGSASNTTTEVEVLHYEPDYDPNDGIAPCEQEVGFGD